MHLSRAANFKSDFAPMIERKTTDANSKFAYDFTAFVGQSNFSW